MENVHLVQVLTVVPNSGRGREVTLDVTLYDAQHALVEGAAREGVHHLEEGVPDIQDNIHYVLGAPFVLQIGHVMIY